MSDIVSNFVIESASLVGLFFFVIFPVSVRYAEEMDVQDANHDEKDGQESVNDVLNRLMALS